MSKLKQPIIFEIAGTSFEVDIDKQVLRQINNSSHEISFITQMTDKGDHYLLSFDRSANKVAAGNVNPDNIEPVIVPTLAQLDPDGMSEKYGIPINELKGKTDFEIMVDQQALAQRHHGVLPQIDLAGERFIIDLRLHELRHAQNFHPVLSFKSFELTGDGWHYEGYYHTTMRQLVTIDPELTEFPDNVVKLRLPNELGLDPVATARAYNMDEREVLRRFPVQLELKAEVIPLSETQIPELIRRNRQQLREQHEQNARKIKPRHRPRF